MNNSNSQRPGQQEAIDATAAAWLARRDQGFRADQEAEFALWRFSDPRHAAAVQRLESAWGALDALRDFRPEAAIHPDSQLLAPAKSNVARFPAWSGALAAAALVMIGLFVWTQVGAPPPAAPRQAIIHPGPERVTLDDGSVVELNTGAKIDVQFTPGERRVRLVRGEAHFNVAKNPARPFVVAGGQVSVRAVGTAFAVALGPGEVAVLVTEGSVRVSAETDAVNAATVTGTTLTIGQRLVIETTAGASAEILPVVENVTPAQIEQALSWQAMRLEFVAMPLGDVVAEFNRYNRQRLIVHDAAAAKIIVEGNFRADNVEGFARLLEASFGVTVTRIGDELHLRKAP